MQGYVLGAEGFCEGDLVAPELRADEVRVAVEHVCLEALGGASDYCPGGGLVGMVVECGDAASAFMGARVLVPQVIACGECDTCRRGAATVCPSRSILGVDRHGGCAETIVCAGRWLTRSTDDLNIEGPIAALMAGPGLLAYALFCRAGATAGDVTIVLGGGATATILAHLVESRGAKLVRSGHEGQPAKAQEIAEGLVAQDCQHRPQKIFVCDGEENLKQAVLNAHPSSLIITAIGAGQADTAILHQRELSLLSVGYGHPDLLPEAAALVVKGELDIGDVLREGILGPSSVSEHRDAASDGKCLVVHRG